ncbi:hypothetical protein HOE04_03840 [archaeon]|jgi:hypothetical protein|nr:hypothetical protein [archaeon]
MTTQLLKKIKANKKYKTISDEIVNLEIKKYIKNHTNETEKTAIKNIRAILHRTYSSFQTKKKNKIPKLLTQLKANPNNKQILEQLLEITISTKERLNNYKKIYKKIITPNTKTIIDLASGLNPFSIPLIKNKNLTYYAYDIDEQDMKHINQFLKITKTKGKAQTMDITNKSKIDQLPKSDIVFLFKALDVIDKKNHKPSEQLLLQLIKKTNLIVASFATKTITRKPMNNPNRKWFELMLERNNLHYKKFKTDNEIFYMIKS